jgi:hypothetical protein
LCGSPAGDGNSYNAVDMMPTGIDRLTAAPKANHLKALRVSGYRQDDF